MGTNLNTMELIKVLLPLIILELILKIICLRIIFTSNVKYFPKVVWALIVIFVSTFGPLSFLIFGRNTNQ